MDTPAKIREVGGLLNGRGAADAATREALERGRLVEELLAVVADIASRLDHREVLHRIARAAVDLVGADGGAYADVSNGGSTIVAVHGLPASLVGFAIEPGEGVMGEVVSSGTTVVVGDYGTHPQRITAIADQLEEMHTLVAVPSLLSGAVSGALFVLFRQQDRGLTEPELAVLSLLAGHAATALANAEAFGAVLRREAHEQAVVEALADGVAVVSPDGVVTSWNSAAAAMTGIPATDAVGRPPPVPTGVTGAPVEHQLPGDRWIEVHATPLADTGETVLVLRDVSDQKEMERAQNLFLAATTHEIKTPLTVISGFATTLQRRWSDLSADEIDGAVNAIARRSDALVRLIDQLLLGFRVQAGQIEVDLRALDVREVLRTAVAEFGGVSDKHTIELHLPAELPLVIGDARAVDDAVGQLLENAVKYSPDGGRVTVSARAESTHVTVSVIDQGVGLSEKDAAHVFDRFYRGTGADGRRVGGVGLGLYIVRQLVEAQGGTVRASGVPGEGARFDFTLPVAPAASVATP